MKRVSEFGLRNSGVLVGVCGYAECACVCGCGCVEEEERGYVWERAGRRRNDQLQRRENHTKSKYLFDIDEKVNAKTFHLKKNRILGPR